MLSYNLGTTDTPGLRTYLDKLGAPIPGQMAGAREVAELGLARLPEGPVCNWGVPNDEAGPSGQSADQRRARVETASGYVKAFMGVA